MSKLDLARSRLPPSPRRHASTVDRLNHGAAVLAAGVLVDSSLEHYRGSFHNAAMYVAPIVSVAGLTAAAAPRLLPARGGLRTAILAASALTGVAGVGFHLFNTSQRVGTWNWMNLFRGAPLLAPLALTMSGVLGLAASGVASHGESGDRRAPVSPRATAALGMVAAAGLAGTAAEATVLHFRGAYQNPLMYAPVVIPPLAAGAVAVATLSRSQAATAVARKLLGATAFLGVAGTGLHVWGVHRRMGGWRNWSQNVFAGPPLPAPSAFVGLALAGLAVCDLLSPSRQ